MSDMPKYPCEETMRTYYMHTAITSAAMSIHTFCSNVTLLFRLSHHGTIQLRTARGVTFKIFF